MKSYTTNYKGIHKSPACTPTAPAAVVVSPASAVKWYVRTCLG